MKNRALRRWIKGRLKERAVRLYGFPKAIRYADNLTPCSCPMCGNRRRHDGPTLQERRAEHP